MLAPEVWSFTPPGASYIFKQCSYSDNSSASPNVINFHHFNHLVSVVIPNSSTVPKDVAESLQRDSSYYKIKNINIVDLLNKEFIEGFVKNGNLYVLSDGTHIDTDDCMCITPSGHLVLNVQRESFLELGVYGTPSAYCAKNPDRYVITIDLKAQSFSPGKKFYEQVKASLGKYIGRKFDVLISWEPPDDELCPSSVVAYLNAQGNEVELCEINYEHHNVQNVSMPLLPKNDDDEADMEDILEWLGAFSLDVDLQKHSDSYEAEYLNSYEVPEKTVTCASVNYFQWTGFFSVQKIQKLYELLKSYVTSGEVQPWASIYVQGFSDSPISWNLREHTFYTEGDNNYTVFLEPTSYRFCSVCSSYRRPRALNKKRKK